MTAPNKRRLEGLGYFVRTFGCQMNLHDAERVAGLLESEGAVPCATPEEADIVVFMTCCVREKADTHLYGQASAMASAPVPPSGLRTVCIGGCIAQRDGERLKKQVPVTDVVFGTQAISRLPGLIEQARSGGQVAVDTQELYDGFSTDLPSHRASKAQAWVPIMTGCNNFCSYCVVPYVRGRERSRAFEDVVAEVEALVADGAREVTLLGQNVNSYGRDLYGEPRFAELLRAVGATGIERIRFTSSHPKDLSDETIRAMAETPAVMPQLHLAVQSGSTDVLRRMNRKYTREDYLALVRRIKEAMPDILLTTDLIVGFPLETEQDFEDTLSLVREAGFAGAFTFIYSKREGTPAAQVDDPTPREVIQERFERLAKLIEEQSWEANQRFAGQTVEVLVEGPSKKDPRRLTGHSRENVTVHFPTPEGLEPDDLIGKLVDVSVDNARTWYLSGTMVGQAR